MTKITPDNFAEFSPNMWKSSESKKFGENAVVLPEKLTDDLKDLVKHQKDSGYSNEVISPNDTKSIEKYQNSCYVYHRVPDTMMGTVLYPLNQLRDINTELYQLYAEGYKDRPKLLQTKVPVLDCLWNDTLFFSPVHPQKLYDIAKEVGLESKWRFKKFFAFKIGQDMQLDKAVIFYRVGKDMDAMAYRPAKEVKISELNEVPSLTRAYYQLAAEKKEALFPYQFVPQLLLHSTIDTANVEVIELR